MRAETQDKLRQVLGSDIKSVRAVSGGDIAQAYLLETQSEKVFCKIMEGESAFEMLLAEKEGLEHVCQTGPVKTPRVYFCEDLGNLVCLGMEYVESKVPTPGEMQQFGEQLAQMHQSPQEDYGYRIDNFIGRLPQSNRIHTSWVSFYIHERLQPQFEMAVSQRLMGADEIPETERLKEVLSSLLTGVKSSLLHGDLWSGNYLISKAGDPYLIDPAVYFGDAAVDLAMTRLFGGFSADFYKAYGANSHIVENEEDKTQLYQLYYLLVHLNLFGSSYYGSVKRIMNRYF